MSEAAVEGYLRVDDGKGREGRIAVACRRHRVQMHEAVREVETA